MDSVGVGQRSARWYAKRRCRSSTPRLAQKIKIAEFYNYSKFYTFFFFRINLYNCLVAIKFSQAYMYIVAAVLDI